MPLGTCKLCLTKDSDLQDSHLQAKAGYRLLRESPGIAPVVVREVMMMKDEQVRDYVFCAACEDRFNKNGKTWILQHCYREDEQSFVLRDLLLAAPPFIQDKEVTVFTTANIPSVEVAKLVYFASSIFWKASVHEWKTGKELLNAPKLGRRYEEEFRSYLLGGSFAANAWLHLAVITDSKILECLHHAVSAVWGWIHADIVFVFRTAVHVLAGVCCAARDSADCVLPFSDEPPAPLRWLGGILLMA